MYVKLVYHPDLIKCTFWFKVGGLAFALDLAVHHQLVKATNLSSY